MAENSDFNIALITDENFVNQTVVTITSLTFNSTKTNHYNIYVLCNNVSENQKKLLLACETENIKINVLDTQNYIENLPEIQNGNPHVNKSALIKFFLPNIFKDLDKILYMDSDILALNDIKELFDVDLKDNYIAAVQDIFPIINKQYLENLGIINPKYFNSGVMLLNLDKMRKDDMVSKLIEYRLNNKTFCMDQDTFNVLLGNKCIFLQYKFNLLFTCLCRYSSSYFCKKYKEKVEKNKKNIIKNAVILHFADDKKPWICDRGGMTKLYKKYWEMSPIADSFPILKKGKTNNYQKLKILINLIFN